MKGVKVRKAVVPLVDMDYVDGVRDKKGNLVIRPLNDSERAWLIKGIDEVYCGGYSKPDSLHRTELGPEEYAAREVELNANHNAQNSDMSTFKALLGTDLKEAMNVTKAEFKSEKEKKGILNEEVEQELEQKLAVKSPREVMVEMIREVVDEVQNEDDDKTLEILEEHTFKVIMLFVLLRKSEERERRAVAKARTEANKEANAQEAAEVTKLSEKPKRDRIKE